MEIGRIQQNNPAATFKANLTVLNGEPRLAKLIEDRKPSWARGAFHIGNLSSNIYVTITPTPTKYAINGTQETKYYIYLFSDMIPNSFIRNVVAIKEELPKAIGELEQRVDTAVRGLIMEIARRRH